jgi:glycosyltransferase involved in cell wall biosynthesis
MTIRLIGQINDSGIGTHFHGYVTAAKRIPELNDQIKIINFQDRTALRAAAQASTLNDIAISFVCTAMTPHFRGTNINWTVFESTRVPSHLLPILKDNDIWIPTEWGRKMAIENGLDIKRIDVVPEGVDGDLFHPYFVRDNTGPFRFLIIGKYERRKSIDETIDAFARSFRNDSAVELVIKSDFFVEPEKKRLELIEKIRSANCTNIHLVWGYQTRTELAELYRSANAFVFPTKAEGWGLPLMEAAACGLPVITTYHSGQTEFLQHIRSSCVFVDYSLQDIDCAEYQGFYREADGRYGQWAVSTVDDIAGAMKQAYRQYPALRQQAHKNSTIIRNQYSWAASVTKSLEILQKRGLL